MYVKDHRFDSPAAAAAKSGKRKLRNTEISESESGEAGAPEGPATSYDFYNQLPKFEVTVPEKDRGKNAKPDQSVIPETRKGTYVLQAGSYKSYADADRVRAQLALKGVESSVQRVTADNETWHRIRIGPISKLDDLNRLRVLLRKADLDVKVIRVGD